MTLLQRGHVAAPTLAKETHDVPALHGELIVRGLKASERLTVGREARESIAAGSGDDFMARLLARCVVDAESRPFWTLEEWDIFATQHPADAAALFAVALRLNGYETADEKKS